MSNITTNAQPTTAPMIGKEFRVIAIVDAEPTTRQ